MAKTEDSVGNNDDEEIVNNDDSVIVSNNSDDEEDVEEEYDGHTSTRKSDDGKSIFRELGILKKTSLLRREFRIKGQIGEAGQPDKLSYISLMHQINEGKQQGYDDNDIVNGVIRAMMPNLTLRNVLETMSNLNLDRLLSFMEAHFGEKVQQNYGVS